MSGLGWLAAKGLGAASPPPRKTCILDSSTRMASTICVTSILDKLFLPNCACVKKIQFDSTRKSSFDFVRVKLSFLLEYVLLRQINKAVYQKVIQVFFSSAVFSKTKISLACR